MFYLIKKISNERFTEWKWSKKKLKNIKKRKRSYKTESFVAALQSNEIPYHLDKDGYGWLNSFMTEVSIIQKSGH